ncbi:MAG: hypothetical protein WDN69_31640 [Aliidongia sp.]
MPTTPLFAVGIENSVTVPDKVTRAILLVELSVTQNAPSGPSVKARIRTGRGRQLEFRDRAVLGDLGEPGHADLQEPHIAVGAGRDLARLRILRR